MEINSYILYMAHSKLGEGSNNKTQWTDLTFTLMANDIS